MTRKVYKSAMGKPVDIGSLILQNEQVRAVGNMNVNARGDVLDSGNRVIDQKNRQVQRHYRKQSTNMNNIPVAKSTREARQAQQPPVTVSDVDSDTFSDLPEDDLEMDLPVATQPTAAESEHRGGLAAAIARTREVKQELDKTRRQLQQEQSLKKI
jgi:hypothetical protein